MGSRARGLAAGLCTNLGWSVDVPALNDSVETETLYQPLWCEWVVTRCNKYVCNCGSMYHMILWRISNFLVWLCVCVRVCVCVGRVMCMFACMWIRRTSFCKETHECKPSVIYDMSQTVFLRKNCCCFYLNGKFVAILKHIRRHRSSCTFLFSACLMKWGPDLKAYLCRKITLKRLTDLTTNRLQSDLPGQLFTSKRK